MHKVYLGLGSNLDPHKNIYSALSDLNVLFGITKQSSIYRSTAIGFSGDDFLNLVVQINTDFALQDLARCLKQLEYQYERKNSTEKFSSRKLDVDILAFDNYCGRYGRITLPRPEVRLYAYVLCPFAEIAPDLVLYEQPTTLSDLWREFDYCAQSIECLKVKREK